jgi:nucleoside-diphosphate kinase
MLSGPVVAFLLIGQCAIAKLQWLAGDVDPEVAKLKHPTSLRAIFGQVLSANAVHVSESPACVENVCIKQLTSKNL